MSFQSKEIGSIIEGDILGVEDNPHDAEMVIRSLKKQNIRNRIVHLTGARKRWTLLLRKYYPKTHTRVEDGHFRSKPSRHGGLEVLRYMKADPRTKYVPVVILTSFREEQDAIEGYELGVSSYILKSTMLRVDGSAHVIN